MSNFGKICKRMLPKGGACRGVLFAFGCIELKICGCTILVKLRKKLFCATTFCLVIHNLNDDRTSVGKDEGTMLLLVSSKLSFS